MMYFKVTENGYILTIGTRIAGEEITEAEYNAILSRINSAPIASSGYTYKLRADTLEWELAELPPMPDPEPTIEDKAEAFDILMGVSE